MTFLLGDLSDARDAALRRRSRSEFALMALRLLVTARSGRDLRAEFPRWLQALEKVLAAPNGVAAFAALMEYILRVTQIPVTELREMVQPLGATADEGLMTGAQQLIEQGRAEGLAKGRLELVLMQLETKFGPLDTETKERVRAASAGDLDQVARRLLSATTLDDVLG
jgi:hypothetical protein